MLFEAERFRRCRSAWPQLIPDSPRPFAVLHARLLMKAGRMAEAAEVIRRRQGNSVRLNLSRRTDGDHALLSFGHGDGQ